MLSADEREKLERDFAEAEASVRLEGLTPSANFFAVKARVLAGEISFEQGREDILAYRPVKTGCGKNIFVRDAGSKSMPQGPKPTLIVSRLRHD